MTIRVLVVDDSAVVRKVVSSVLAAEDGIEVVGTANNGQVALERLEELKPDLVTLDVEMPVLDGVATVRRLRTRHPRLPVIMFSTLTERGARITVEALLAGANEYAAKPSKMGSMAEAMAQIRGDLVPRVRALCAPRTAPPPRQPDRTSPVGEPSPTQPTQPTQPARPTLMHRPVAGVRRPPQAAPRRASSPRPTPSRPPQRPRRAIPGRVDAVVVGSSTGGPNALAELLGAVPADLPVPMVIVQHMPPTFTRMLAERLDTVCPLSVQEAYDGAPVEPGRVWLAPGGRHLQVRGEGTTLRLSDGPPENSCRPAVDVLFRSAAAAWGGGVLAVVLTGMGYDGLKGGEVIVAEGGHVLAQDEASSVVWGMPGAVAQAGVAETVAPVPQLAAEIARRTCAGRVLRPGAAVRS